MPPPGVIQTSFGPLSSLPSKSLTTTVALPAGSTRQSSFVASAQAQRFPWASKHSPLARPHGCRKVESFPSVLHFRMRSLGWSVKKTFPCASQAGPSVNANPSASFCKLSPGAMILLSAASNCAQTRLPSRISIARLPKPRGPMNRLGESKTRLWHPLPLPKKLDFIIFAVRSACNVIAPSQPELVPPVKHDCFGREGRANRRGAKSAEKAATLNLSALRASAGKDAFHRVPDAADSDL